MPGGRTLQKAFQNDQLHWQPEEESKAPVKIFISEKEGAHRLSVYGMCGKHEACSETRLQGKTKTEA